MMDGKYIYTAIKNKGGAAYKCKCVRYGGSTDTYDNRPPFFFFFSHTYS